MIAAPAVDVRDGRCVQLVGGRPEDERVSLPDPSRVAARWRAVGFRVLHVVDLDAALGSGDNLATVREVVGATDAEVQVGGGVRSEDRAEALLAAGARRVIVGTRAVDDPDWLASLATRLPDRIMVAADIRGGRVLTKGWTEDSGLTVDDFLRRIDGLPLAGVLITDVGQEGRLQGIRRDDMADILHTTEMRIWASGGITTEDDLDFLDTHGAAGAVLGMAIYTDTLDPAAVARRWGGPSKDINLSADDRSAGSGDA